MAARMRMIMADRRRPAGPRRPMCGDQRRRIDLEAVTRFGGDVGARTDLLDIASLAKQKPANLGLRARRRGLSNFIEQHS